MRSSCTGVPHSVVVFREGVVPTPAALHRILQMAHGVSSPGVFSLESEADTAVELLGLGVSLVHEQAHGLPVAVAIDGGTQQARGDALMTEVRVHGQRVDIELARLGLVGHPAEVAP